MQREREKKKTTCGREENCSSNNSNNSSFCLFLSCCLTTTQHKKERKRETDRQTAKKSKVKIHSKMVLWSTVSVSRAVFCFSRSSSIGDQTSKHQTSTGKDNITSDDQHQHQAVLGDHHHLPSFNPFVADTVGLLQAVLMHHFTAWWHW